MTTNISIADHPVGSWCPVCLDAWTAGMVPVAIKINWNTTIVICGQCAREMGITARKEQRRRRRESEAVRGTKGQGQ